MQGALRHSVGIGKRILWRLAFEGIIEASHTTCSRVWSGLAVK